MVVPEPTDCGLGLVEASALDCGLVPVVGFEVEIAPMSEFGPKVAPVEPSTIVQAGFDFEVAAELDLVEAELVPAKLGSEL